MRLLVVSSWFPFPPVNGSKLRAWHLLQELARRHEITLATFAEPGEASPDHVDALRACCADVVVIPGNPNKPRSALSRTRFLGRMPRSYAQTYSSDMARAVAHHRPGHDAAVAFQLGAALYLTRRDDLPGVFDEAEVSLVRDPLHTAANWRRRVRRTLTWWKYGRFVRGLVASFSRTTVVSDIERGKLGEAGCDLGRVSVVPNGVGADYLRVEVPKIPDTLIYPGALTYWANFEAVRSFLEQTFPRVRAANPAVRLYVTGSCAGAPLERLPSLDGVVLTGFVEDIARRIAESAVCVVPLLHGGGTRLKVLEAMALGTPVVTTTKGAEGLDVNPGRDLITADQPEAFARSVVDLLGDPLRASAVARGGRELVAARYTWNRIGGTLEEVLRCAIEQHHPFRGRVRRSRDWHLG